MNHGKCKNCFWFKQCWCYMWNNKSKEESYCPDYFNRNRTKDKLEDTDIYKIVNGIK